MRPAALLAALSALGLTFTLMVGPALATHVEPTEVGGNPTCAELGNYDFEFKVEPVSGGTHDDPDTDFSVEITLHDTPDGQTFDFDANMDVNAVFAKGGNTGNLYVYDPAESSDTGLHSPENASGDYAALSHISFCWNEPDEESEEASVEESVPASVEESVPASVEESVPASVEESTEASVEQSVQASVEESEAASPEGSVLGGTGTPAPSTPDTAMGAGNGPSPLPTIAFGAILLASLAGLAWVNVQAVRSRS